MPTFLSQIYYGNGKNIIFLSYYLTKGSSFHIWIGKLVSSLVTRKLVSIVCARFVEIQTRGGLFFSFSERSTGCFDPAACGVTSHVSRIFTAQVQDQLLPPCLLLS